MNITKKIIALAILIGFTICLNAQQTPMFSEYNYNPFLINSAYAGLTRNTEFSMSNAGFFNQFEGSPRSFSFSGHGALSNNKMGLGAGIIRDEIGVTTSTSFFAAYSYKIFFDFKSNRPYWQLYDAGVLSFGITAGLQQYQNNLTELGIITDPKFAQDINTSIPTVGLSFLFNHASFYVGFSTPNVIGDALASNDRLILKSPFYGYLGYRIYSNRFRDLMIKPNLLLKHEEGSPLQADINVAVSFKNKFEIGTGYRTSNSINFLAGFYLFNNIRAIYNYNIANKNSPLGNTHGFILSLQLGDGYQTN
ncbi:type IX secretion system membrane protein PorP/SprF [Postechiella marina]|uniref:Type IX secretion system membrane protein PorP/SprF n=1 Tax=Postechiella marina TaxID=943941 RepID=A0ABP8CC77_9FLAO